MTDTFFDDLYGDLTPKSLVSEDLDRSYQTTSDEFPSAPPLLQDPSTSDDEPPLQDESMLDHAFDEALENEKTYGGLVNLGNLCYQNAALQMLASLDDFVESIRVRELPEGKDTRLRTSFLEIMKKLNEGTTVQPDDFKAIIDERSPLFVGYDQQDAHEFITSLLDMLDEDYKVKNDGDEQDDGSKVGEDDRMDVSEHKRSDSMSTPLSCKRARTESEMREDDDLTQQDSSIRSERVVEAYTSLDQRRSFCQLDMKDIGNLLYETVSPRPSCSLESPMNQEPRCKLVGGRMNTTDVILAPYNAPKSSSEGSPSRRRPKKEAGHSQQGSESGEAMVEQRRSPVDEYFTTTVRVRLTCDSCKYSRCHKESFLHLSLEIGPEVGSVEDGLRRFFAPEKRDLKCEKCFSGSATQTMEIIELPRALLLHFKRFIVEVSPDYSSVSYRKNQSIVVFEETLAFEEEAGGVMSEFLAHDCAPAPCTNSSPAVYSLRSVVNHIGMSASCGHYTADAHRKDEDGQRVWTRFNDEYVREISAKEAIEDSQHTAYLVVYELS